jgi:hypothetical protein
MKIEMYVLCLQRFRDGRIVFRDGELNSIKDAIADGLQNQNLFTGDRKPRDGFEVYRLVSKEVETCLSQGATVESAEIGYYHHRVIVYLRLNSADDFSKLREVRDQLKQWVDNMIEHGVQDQINGLAHSGMVRAEAEVECFYTYPLIVLKRRPKRFEAFPFSEETSSLCFDIVEPSWFRPPGKKHMMRISMPGTILYHGGREIGKNLLRDIVNALYQYRLYEQKSRDKRPFKNVLDESLLIKLWEQIIDRLGGSTMEVHISRLTFAISFFAILAFIISVGTLIVTLILR